MQACFKNKLNRFHLGFDFNTLSITSSNFDCRNCHQGCDLHRQLYNIIIRDCFKVEIAILGGWWWKGGNKVGGPVGKSGYRFRQNERRTAAAYRSSVRASCHPLIPAYPGSVRFGERGRGPPPPLPPTKLFHVSWLGGAFSSFSSQVK